MSKAFLMKSLIATAIWHSCSGIAEAYDCDQATYNAAYQKMDLAFKMGVLRNDSGGSVLFQRHFGIR